MKTIVSFVAVLLLGSMWMPNTASAHCQIPCGIYDDAARLAAMEEHVTTIEKSIKEIEQLSRQQPPNWNQLVRWVMNKEEHADQLTQIVTYYFMAQRVKPPADPSDKAAAAKYVRQLTLLHQIMVTAMKTKQSTNLDNCAKLRDLIGRFKTLYLGEHAASKPHGHSHKVASQHQHSH